MRTMNARYARPQSIIRFLRMYHGYTQGEMAKACGLTAMDICRLESGRFGMAASKAKKLSKFFRVSLDDIVHDNYAAVLPKLSEVPARNERVKAIRHKKNETMERIGTEGEAFVADLERKKLQGTPYAHGVNEAFADDPCAGFDIMSFTRAGAPLFIEVKTTKDAADAAFFMTANEYAFMLSCLENGCKYELHRVYGMKDGNDASRVIYTAEELMNFDFTTNEYLVRCA